MNFLSHLLYQNCDEIVTRELTKKSVNQKANTLKVIIYLINHFFCSYISLNTKINIFLYHLFFVFFFFFLSVRMYTYLLFVFSNEFYIHKHFEVFLLFAFDVCISIMQNILWNFIKHVRIFQKGSI